MFKDLLQYLPSIHKEGYIFIVIFFFVTLVLFSLGKTLGIIGVVLTVWCICFFRDPERVMPLGENLVVSPADGVVELISNDIEAPEELGLFDHKFTRVSVFLSVFDVHVNRIPVNGTIEKLHYHHGKFFNASLDKASEFNERQTVLIKNKEDDLFPVVQIAGLIARRIVCYLDENQEVKAGDRFGIIRFGSRVDLYIPDGYKLNVRKGQYMIGGETQIAVKKAGGAKKIAAPKIEIPVVKKIVTKAKSTKKSVPKKKVAPKKAPAKK